jgi:hypothetical protein
MALSNIFLKLTKIGKTRDSKEPEARNLMMLKGMFTDSMYYLISLQVKAMTQKDRTHKINKSS